MFKMSQKYYFQLKILESVYLVISYFQSSWYDGMIVRSIFTSGYGWLLTGYQP